MILDLDKIKKLLPHRKPFLFVDSCKIIESGKIGIGRRRFLSDEYFFKGHFPETPIVPGVILIEALAQTAGIVVASTLSNQSEKSVLFMSISNAKFRKPVLPDDEIVFEINITNQVKSVYKCYGEAKKNSDRVCEASFSAMIIEKSYSNILK